MLLKSWKDWMSSLFFIKKGVSATQFYSCFLLMKYLRMKKRHKSSFLRIMYQIKSRTSEFHVKYISIRYHKNYDSEAKKFYELKEKKNCKMQFENENIFRFQIKI